MMNSSQFTDKQITALSGSQGGGEFFDLMNPQEEHHQNSNGGGLMKKEEVLFSYDFQPIRSVGSSPTPMNAGLDGAARHSRASADSKMASSSLRFSGILEHHELAKVSHEKERDGYNVATVAEIDCTVKKHSDNLLHALEGVSSRLSQLESRTCHLESSVDELKVSVGNNNGCTDGKLRQLENILREVQTSMQVLLDKQKIAEAQLQLTKLQASKGDHLRPENSHTGQIDSRRRQQQQQVSQQPVQQSPQPPIAPPQPPSFPSLPAPNAPPQQNPSPLQLTQSQVPSLPSLPREAYFSPPGQSADAAHHQYQMPAQQSQQPSPAQHYKPSPQVPHYSRPMQPSQPVNPSPQFQRPLPPHHPEESAPYMPPRPPQTYTPSNRQPAPLTQPPSGPSPPQQYYGSNPSAYETPTSRSGSGQLSFPSGYGPSFPGPYTYSGSPSHHYSSSSSSSSSSMKPSPFSSSTPSAGGSNYPRLPTAQKLPQALPTGSSSGGGTTGNRVPVDDIVDKVATMGFSREQVRATVRKLTENGQSVDLNVVLDKLMNDGVIQPQKGWFGR